MAPIAQPSSTGKWKRAAQWVGVVLGGVVALAVVTGFGLYLGLQTRPGGRLLRRIALSEINKSIAGRVDLGTIEFHGTALTVRDVVLFDTTNAPVVKVARLSLAYRLLGLLAHRVDVEAVELERPEIDLVKDADGLNVSRAVAARKPTPPPPAPAAGEKSGPGWEVNLVRLSLVDGSVHYAMVPAPPGGLAQRLSLDALSVEAAGRIQTASHDGELHLAVGGRANGPAAFSDELLGINVHLIASVGHATGKADVSLGRFLALDATLGPTGDAEIHLGRVRVPPALARTFAASWPVVVPLLLTGKITLTDGVAAGELALRGEGVPGALTVRGDGRLADNQTLHGIRLEARTLSLSRFVANLPPTGPLALTVDVAPGSLLPDALSLTVNVDAPRTVLSRQPFGPMHLDAKVGRGVLTSLNLELPVPGAVITARGGQRNDKTAVSLRVLVGQLAALRAAVLALAPATTLPPLAGAGSVEVSASGPHRLTSIGAAGEWTVRAQVAIPRLKVGTSHYRGIVVDARVPELTSDRQSLDVAASLKAPFASSLSLSASIRESLVVASSAGTVKRVDVQLTRMALSYPGTRWVTHGAAGASIENAIEEAGPGVASESRMAVHDFALFAGAQQLSIDARRDDSSITADVKVTNLRVQDLPPVKMAKLKVAGLLAASVHAKGDPARPRVDARVSLEEGVFDGYKGVGADIVATLLENRTVRGKARVSTARMGNLEAEFSGPGATPLPPGAPISATIDITDVKVQNLPIPPSAGLEAEGNLQAHLDVRGTIRDPRISLHVTGRHMSVNKPAKSEPATTTAVDEGSGALARREGDPAAGLQTAKFETLALDFNYASPTAEARLALVDGERGSFRAAATSKIPFAEARASGGLALGRRAIIGSINLTNLDPQAAGAFVPSLKELRGQITAAFDIRGTVGAPRIGGEMSWRNGKVVVVPEKKPVTRDTAQAGAAGKPHASRGEVPHGAALLTEMP